MAAVSRATLKSYFTAGKYPTASNFEDLIDSITSADGVLASPASNGIVARTSGTEVTGRSITVSGNGITVSAGNGVAAGPEIRVSAAVAVTGNGITVSAGTSPEIRTSAAIAVSGAGIAVSAGTSPEIKLSVVGLQTAWVPANAMVARSTNGAASVSREVGTNRVMTKTMDFDTATQEFAQFSVRFPKGWNEGTVQHIPLWYAASGAASAGVVWACQAGAFANAAAIDTAFGTEQTSTDELLAADQVHIAPTSPAITIAGSAKPGDWVTFQVKRNVADAADTLGVDAKLLGSVILFTTDATEDS